MINITYTKDNTHVVDSYKVTTTKSIENYVSWIKEARTIRKLPVTRTFDSYVREWKGHNNLYNIGLFRSHTASVDLNENNSIIEELIWLIIGR